MRALQTAALGLVAVWLLVGCSDSGSVIARVGDRDITHEEFQAYLKFKRIPAQDAERVDQALNAYLRRAALALAVEREGTLDAALIQAELEEFRREMLISRHFETHLRDAVAEDSIENYYTQHIDNYRSESVHGAHILIRLDTRMSEAERQAKRTQAHEVYSRLQAGEDFGELAKAYSEDRVSAEKNGDLGWLRRGAVSEEFSARLFGLETGAISEPFLTEFGFHIVKKIEGPQTVTRPLEAVSGDIRYQLRNQAHQAELDRLIDTVTISRKD